MKGFYPLNGPQGVFTFLGGIIIEIRGEQAIVHHGGYRDRDGQWQSLPFLVPWHTKGPNLVFDLRGWECRIMQVFEGHRVVDILSSPICTTDGEFTVDWSTPTKGPTPQQLTVYYA